MAVVEDILKFGVEEGSELLSSNISLVVVIDDNIEGEVSGTEDGRRQGTNGEVLGSTNKA